MIGLKKLAFFVGGAVFGSAGIKLLSSKANIVLKLFYNTSLTIK